MRGQPQDQPPVRALFEAGAPGDVRIGLAERPSFVGIWPTEDDLHPVESKPFGVRHTSPPQPVWLVRVCSRLVTTLPRTMPTPPHWPTVPAGHRRSRARSPSAPVAIPTPRSRAPPHLPPTRPSREPW